MIERVRPTPEGAELAAMYAVHNAARHWLEHRLRIELTLDLGIARFPFRDLVVDPAAGTGDLARRLATGEAFTGDLAPTAPVDRPGVAADAFLADLFLRNIVADVVVLGEILEHVDDPARLLAQARDVSRGLIVSTPLDEPAGVNPEHVWRWDRAGILELLAAAGWHPTGYVELDLELKHWPPGYRCQIHTAEARP